MSEDEYELQSDVSLDEEDEELIWRVFYAPIEERSRSASAHLTDDHSDSEDSESSITDLSDIEDPELVSKYRELRNTKIEDSLKPDDEKRLLLSNFDEEKMKKYEAFRTLTINKIGVKKVCNSVLGHSIPQNIAVIMAGLSKTLVAEIITRAFEVQEREFKANLIMDIERKKNQKREILKSLEEGKEVEVDDKPLEYQGDKGQPLQPEHIREAWRLYRLENSGVFNAQFRRQGEADGLMFR